MVAELSSRTKHLKRTLSVLGFKKAYEALELVIDEMSVENGFARHNGKHYYYHLVDVAQMLLNFGIRDEDTIVAALLHDYIEDVQGVTYRTVENQFGSNVADIVDLVTKEKGIDYKNNPSKMQEYLDNIYESPEACLVKTADRVNNFQTLRDSSLDHRKKQLANTVDYFIPFFKKCRNKYIEHESFYFQAKTTIEPIAYEVGRYLEDLEEYKKLILEQNEEISRLKGETAVSKDNELED